MRQAAKRATDGFADAVRQPSAAGDATAYGQAGATCLTAESFM